MSDGSDTFTLALYGVKVETYAALYLVTAGEGETLHLKFREVLALALLLQTALQALHFEIAAGRELVMVSHPDGREELILR